MKNINVAYLKLVSWIAMASAFGYGLLDTASHFPSPVYWAFKAVVGTLILYVAFYLHFIFTNLQE